MRGPRDRIAHAYTNCIGREFGPAYYFLSARAALVESRAAPLKSNGQFEACHFQPDTDLPSKLKVSNQNTRCATSVLRLAIFYACISLRVAPRDFVLVFRAVCQNCIVFHFADELPEARRKAHPDAS